MNVGRIRTRHIYVSALAAFVGLVGFEGVRMAAGHDPALASASVATPTTVDQDGNGGQDQGGGLDPNAGQDQGGGLDPNAGQDQGGGLDPNGGGQDLPQDVPQPESRLS